MKTIHNFSFTRSINTKVLYPKNLYELKKNIKKKFSIIGNLRSYGDTAFGRYNHISLLNFKKIINFNKQKKIIEVEAGLLLSNLLKYTLRHNLVLPCMPGCKYVTIGGMIANNISGKLIKKNKIEYFIKSLKLINDKGKIIECSKNKNKKLFDLTIGGKGRTGPIISAVINLRKINSDKFLERNVNFNNFLEFKKNLVFLKKYFYCVVWLDFTSKFFKGIFFFGNHLKKKKSNLSFNFKDISLPNFLLLIFSKLVTSRFFVKLFNFVFFQKFNFFKKRIIGINSFSFPQNKIKNWNILFKNSGFIQFQFYFKISKLNKVVNFLKINLIKKKIYSNFAILKFHGINQISLSLDFPIKNNESKINDFINEFVNKYQLEVELSKDISLKKINKITLKHNQIFNNRYKRFFIKNFNSNIFERIVVE